MSVTTLNQLKEGQTATISGLLAKGSMRRRLQDIGLIEGAKVECLQKSPFGDPVAYLICGAAIALRTVDSDHVMITS